MAMLLLRRAITAIPILVLVSFGVFSLTALIPGDAAVTLAGTEATDEQVEAIRQQLNLDEPFWSRYLHWLSDAAHLNLGNSLVTQTPIADEIAARFPVTLQLAVATVVVALLIAVPVGVLAGLKAGGRPDNFARLFASAASAIPSFWLGPLLLIVFAVQFAWFPSAGFVSLSDSPVGYLHHIVLPASALGMGVAAVQIRQLRSALIDSLDSNSVRTMWATGAGSRVVVGKHALRNAAIPAVTMLGLEFGTLIGGTVITESIFGIQGLGSYALRAVTTRDIPVIQACVLFIAVATILINLVVDLAYGFLNPKVRVQ